MRPFADQHGKLSYPVVSVRPTLSDRLKMRSPAALPGVGPFGGDAPAASFQNRYTTCVPSGDQLGNPELPGPVVSVRAPEPSGFTIMIWAGRVARETK